MISERIKMLREQYNYSQAELANALGIARTSVLAWENQTSVPAMKHLIAIAKLFHISTDYLLEVENHRALSLEGLTDEEISIICSLLSYFDKKKVNRE
ncbi:MAG: helix-turn-helix transcriptional regulator [Ruminococcaceae bacterium]|nr:helix-turn-helix transcriptional regulator [Oscillospiraceae bacterium]